MKLGLIAGNRYLPLLFSRNAKKDKDIMIVAVCFRGETDSRILECVDKAYWIEVGQLSELVGILRKEGIRDCVMIGQITPHKIFKRKGWDKAMIEVLKDIDFRPHSVFSRMIAYLEKEGFNFLDSTRFLQDYLAEKGLMNKVILNEEALSDVEFGLNLISKYVELDVGQTIIVKSKAVVALEGLEGTDNTIKRAYKIAGRDCTVLKFSKRDSDLRFDVPVVGLTTLSLLKKIKAKALVLERGRVLILEKKKFLALADKWGISILGEEKK
jgi:hypothetical protein